MKAVPFVYRRPADLEEACAILAADEDARIAAARAAPHRDAEG